MQNLIGIFCRLMLVLFLYFATWNRSLKFSFSLIFPMATVKVLALYPCFSYFFKFPVAFYHYFSLYSDGYFTSRCARDAILF